MLSGDHFFFIKRALHIKDLLEMVEDLCCKITKVIPGIIKRILQRRSKVSASIVDVPVVIPEQNAHLDEANFAFKDPNVSTYSDLATKVYAVTARENALETSVGSNASEGAEVHIQQLSHPNAQIAITNPPPSRPRGRERKEAKSPALKGRLKRLQSIQTLK